MKLTKYILILLSSITLCAQQTSKLKEDRFNSSLISPTTVHGDMKFSGITDGNDNSTVTFNTYRETKYEKYDVGGTFIYSNPMTSGMVYLTKDCDWFIVSLTLGAYKYNNRSASYTGVYVSHNHENGYFGFGISDIFDVGFRNGTADNFFYFDAKTPKVFVHQKIIALYDFSLGLAASASYHRIEKLNHNMSMELGYKNQYIGIGYSKYNSLLVYAKLSVGRLDFYAGMDHELSMGMGIDF